MQKRPYPIQGFVQLNFEHFYVELVPGLAMQCKKYKNNESIFLNFNVIVAWFLHL